MYESNKIITYNVKYVSTYESKYISNEVCMEILLYK